MGYLTMDMDYVRGIEAELEAYRDTGLTPEEVKTLKEQLDLSRAEVQGLSKKLVVSDKKANFWEREAKKWCAKLGEIRLLIGEQIKNLTY